MIKSMIKTGFRFLLSLSLIFAPVYGYPAPSGGSNGGGSNGSGTPDGSHTPPNSIEELVNRLETVYRDTQREIPTEFQEASQILREMGTALTENRLGEYINSRPGLKSTLDVLSLSNQTVKVLDYAGNTTSAIDFDSENSSTRSYTRILTNIDIGFNDKKKLTLKGVIVSEDKANQLGKTIGLVHTFHDMKKKDVIDWAYDKEFLVILHKKRGLVLYHTMFAYTLLGAAPIPSINIPAPDLSNLKNVKLEFIDRAVAPPKKGIHDKTVAVNLDGKPMFFAGDLLVSYKNSKNKKSIAHVLSRSKDLIPALFKMYVTLESLIRIRDFTTNNNAESNTPYLERHLTDVIKTVLSVTINRKSISFFNRFTDLINFMPYFLLYKYIDKNPDSFLHTEWFASYRKIKQSSPELFDQMSKQEGKIISSADIAKALKPIVAAKKEERDNRFKKWFNNLKQQYPKTFDLVSEHWINMSILVLSSVWAIWQNSLVPHVGGSHNYVSDTVYNIVFLGLGFLLITAVIGKISIPLLKKIKKLPLPGEMKLTIEQIIEKWSGKNILVRDKLAAFGFKAAAALLPLIYRVFQLSGQNHLFSTLTEGVNPLRKITPDSHLGRAANIDRSMRLWVGLPRWLSNAERYEKKSQLIDLIGEQQKRVESLSRIMAYYALSNKPFDITVVLTGPLTLDDKFNYGDKKLIRNAAWVSEKLSEYILRSDTIDTTRPILEWASAVNNDFYQKALDLAQEVKSVSLVRKQTRKLGKAAAKYLRQGLAWNTEYAKILQYYYPNRTVSTQFWYGLIIDHLILVTLPLTQLTPRGDSYSGSLSTAALDSYNFLRSSPPHIHEAALNIVIHDVAVARQQLQMLTVKKNEKLKVLFEKHENLYKPVEEYLNVTENTSGFWQYLLDGLKYPVNWGQRIYEGKEYEERIDVGFQFWKLVRIAFRFWAVTIPLGIASREFITPEYSFYHNVTGTMFFAGAGFILFGLPQIWVFHHNLFFAKKGAETKKIIDGIKLTDHKIENRLYTSSSFLDKDYETTLRGFKKLYSSSRKYRRTVSLDQMDPGIREFILQADFKDAKLREIIQSQAIETKREQLRTISSILKTRHLPTQVNEYGLQIAILLGLGIFSNIAFVYVSDKSFQELDIHTPLLWMGGLALSAYIFSFISAKSISGRIKDVRTMTRTTVRKAGEKIRGMGTSLKNKCSLSFRNRE